MFKIEEGQAVLLVARTNTNTDNLDTLQKLRSTLLTQVGSAGRVDFEQVDRIDEGAVRLESAKYDIVLVSPVEPRVVEHSNRVLESILLALKPKGKLIIQELALDPGSVLQTSPVTRTKDDIVQQLKFSGFVETEVNSTELVSANELHYLAETQWKLGEPSLFVSQADGHLWTATISAMKPSYDVGAATALSFGKKTKKGQNNINSTSANTEKKRVWMLNVESDDETEIVDQDGLLEDEDLIKPSAEALARPEGVKTRRRACKNCTCGLADGGEFDESVACKPEDSRPKKPKKPVDVVNLKSSCGNCGLGDAFRCGQCPFIGLPAFEPGEKVTLGGNMLRDDLLM
ncbi:electron carrier [Coemansia sp. Benny D160-2]|nr:electron carrier [Coemansia sp. Benny D160-2]